ncbi:MAG: glycogen/starch/alpha-glucan phosphorylase, partial [Oscillospiraceae bacterium]|nr:glycogen/starch/alpha-glucan phosphorylase [Oscillospiraceae bacterium]
NPAELHYALGKTLMGEIADNWEKSEKRHASARRAYYFSAEYLMGRMIYNNLYCLGLLDETKTLLKKKGIDINAFEEIDDAALGNGGLGRLAACFLDSAATQNVPLDGYGIRYKYGLFKQLIKEGFQVEVADDWERFGDPWCVRRDADTVTVSFNGQTVKAVPYDMAIIGYGTNNINTLRLWQAEALEPFDFLDFNNGKYDDAVKDRNNAENISRVLYPNDNTYEGKILRLKQQYFFCSASLQDILKKYKAKHGIDFSHFAEETAIQLNDTHPVCSIPELIRLLQLEGLDFEAAFAIAQKTFAYTNHTVLGEALEKWSIKLFKDVLPELYDIIDKISIKAHADYTSLGVSDEVRKKLTIIEFYGPHHHFDGVIHMARLAVYASSYTNGVAWIHTEILKYDVMKEWFALYPERFQNKTNGITQRRWLGLCNPELAEFLTEKVGKGWERDLDLLSKLNDQINGETVAAFNKIKDKKKKELASYILKHDGVKINPKSMFDIQIKRLHEYKRQLLNAFSIIDIYFKIKDGRLPKWNPTTFIFGAKAAPGYARAKAIIKLINEIANKVNNDPDTKDKLQVVFVANYNVSYAEKLVTAADISEQISTAGTEASGTGNMKLMVNGAITLGTYDGANVEICRQAGEENEYIFGARVEEIADLQQSGNYRPRTIFDQNPDIRRVLNTLVDGTFDDGSNNGNGEGTFRELYEAILDGKNWHKADHYFLLRDWTDYVDTKIRANQEFSNRVKFGTKCLRNVANAGFFSSDRTILEYAKDLWHVI